MKQHIFPALRLTVVCILLFMGIYPLLVWSIAKAAPASGEGETITLNGRVVGYKLEGQRFTADRYFTGRPSATGYNASLSGGSNKGPSDSAYLTEVRARIDSFLGHNPDIRKENIPSDLVTASGSGLDPDISLQAALVQAARISAVRAIPERSVINLIKEQTDKSINGIQKINVLRINIALDQLK
ncbi:potassium-transporting ATPase subunit C [Sediminibacterium ginsengisoli]|uniref:Potassium-transporting ATPase KdpC subunit n=1 Tax=Sediminibacterium ginsengisoli TaxID=413434 RepID=A0A1T4KSY7_9BACT|nr:potassium-transporting ATPase subunit C [Sediminibacterium ginsengisoli]SJZ45536.1 K+-transporting ATPase ATPase C chain [Sediminibacterium ginsengisoli]